MSYSSVVFIKQKNLLNHKKYIGQSVNIPRRFKEHKSNAYNVNYEYPNKILYQAIRKYGLKNFSFDVIEYCKREELNEKEIYWISYYDTYKNGYNANLGGDKGIQYDYEQIYILWKSGLSCIEIEKQLNVSDQVITNALRVYGIDEKEAKSRSAKAKLYLALSKDGKPLKLFRGAKQIAEYFDLPPHKADSFLLSLNRGYDFKGFKWKIYQDEEVPEITKEEFFSYQKLVNHNYTQKGREIAFLRRKAERPERQELKEMIRTLPFTQIAKNYGVSDNTIRKWCDTYDLPRLKRDINSYSDKEWELI